MADTESSRPIRLIVPFEAGGQVDLMARFVGEHLSRELGRQVVVDNRAGASGLIGTKTALAAGGDGNTLLFGSASSMALLPHVGTTPPYDPVKDFSTISLIATSPYVLVVQASSKWKSVEDLIKYAKANPGKLTYGSAGPFSGTRISTELFNSMAGIDAVHVGYRGSGRATIALLGGEVSFLLNNLLPSLPHIASGKLKVLAVTTDKRNPALPEVPTVSEAGVPGYEAGAWNGLVAPGHPSKEIIDTYYKAVVASMSSARVRSAIAKQGSEVIISTPGDFTKFLTRENEKWAKVIKKVQLN
jgi:tripartite-type tricarboxylate transporter receptor subunit TctC